MRPATVTVVSGSTLSGIAAKVCSSAGKWPSLFAANRGVIGANPNLIIPGQILRAVCDAVARAVNPRAHAAHLAHLAEERADAAAYVPVQRAAVTAPVQQAPVARVTGVSGGTGPISIPAWASCIVPRESGYPAKSLAAAEVAQNPSSTASGLFQDLDTTWAGYGGYVHAKDAPASVQIEFNQILSDYGRNLTPWAADGCPGT
jgi:hypothetical protein